MLIERDPKIKKVIADQMQDEDNFVIHSFIRSSLRETFLRYAGKDATITIGEVSDYRNNKILPYGITQNQMEEQVKITEEFEENVEDILLPFSQFTDSISSFIESVKISPILPEKQFPIYRIPMLFSPRSNNVREKEKEEMIAQIPNTIIDKYIEELHENLVVQAKNHFHLSKEKMRQKLDNLKNEAEFRKFLMHILPDIGFSQLKHHHGPNEDGKDIIALTREPFGFPELNLFVVKVGDLNKKNATDFTRNMDEIDSQIHQASNTFYTDINLPSIKKARIYVITNGVINQNARSYLTQHTQSMNRLLFIIDKNDLVGKCE
ncbi:hypothetical protein [Candidatus Lokiarchaeum ossiferum]|uniref:hypothetical protein n=1 Tax=Candidatus Lokiarchaeum ossiferum TaxID=2951803 RepID=UPI00352CAC6F